MLQTYPLGAKMLLKIANEKASIQLYDLLKVITVLLLNHTLE